jgi:hypothetical protein
MDLLGRFLRPLADVLHLGLEAGTALGILAIEAMAPSQDGPRDRPRLTVVPAGGFPPADRQADPRVGRTSD